MSVMITLYKTLLVNCWRIDILAHVGQSEHYGLTKWALWIKTEKSNATRKSQINVSLCSFGDGHSQHQETFSPKFTRATNEWEILPCMYSTALWVSSYIHVVTIHVYRQITLHQLSSHQRTQKKYVANLLWVEFWIW